ncbi:MAG: MBOAT family protein [Paludibacter sp.]|nr:MBOAT family protein [Paludibacter sp.]
MLLNFLKDIFVFNSDFPLLFTQFYFWAFFAIVFAGFSLLKSKILLRNAFLAFFSFFFYYKTSGLFVLILFFDTLWNMFTANNIAKSTSEKSRKIYLVAGIVVNLLVLSYFKYSYFIADVVNNIFGIQIKVFDIFAAIGNSFTASGRFDISNILLPVGISFYTFQNISYIMDVFRRKLEPVKNFFNYAFYVSFFPALVAGPIVRANEFIPQIYKKFFLSRRQFGIAVFWILNGLAKKIILSDYLAVNFVDRVFDNPTMYTGFENLMGLFLYSLQVYADFSGYTDIAIGVAMLFGFYLPQNFNSPYKATNASQFWKRWHISLSRWLQDYLYIPLGGNRNASFGTYAVIVCIAAVATILSGSLVVGGVFIAIAAAVWLIIRFRPQKRKTTTTNLNMLNTMLLGGLWHGASWNFMIWGGLNGVGMLIYKFWKDKSIKIRTIILCVITSAFAILYYTYKFPILKIAFVWTAILFGGTFIRFIYNFAKIWLSSKNYRLPIFNYQFKGLATAWAVFQTFVFITFTRLFFRSGSNLDPADANLAAWNTARNMVKQIGGTWDFTIIDDIIWGYRGIFLLFAAGMIIHWLPDRFKRRYRICFASLPLWAMMAVIIIVIFVIYQFISADLQAFIYFQF